MPVTRPSTQEIISNSLQELMRSNSFAKISVSEIMENCGMRRETFYYHFNDKYDLVQWTFQQKVCGPLISDFFGPVDFKHLVGRCVDWLECFRSQEDFVHYLLADEANGFFYNMMIDTVFKILSDHARCSLGAEGLEPNVIFCAKAYAYSIIGISAEWARSCYEDDIETVGTAMAEMVPSGLLRVYRNDLDFTLPEQVEDGEKI